MAAGGLLALLDDITALLDDIAVMTKVAATKTAGITGDDLAVNAEAMVGIDPKRELPIVWRVAKGSFRNKLILVPAALALSAFAEWLITPLLIVGGTFLCFEAAEKVLHAVKPKTADDAHKKDLHKAAVKSADDLVAMEKDKIGKAIKTDFILSAEIVAVSLSAVKDAEFAVQAAVLAAIGIGMTVGVYGLVAGIVKIDDLGMHLAKSGKAAVAATGRGIIRAAPWFMNTLSVVGTVAMFMVGGGILLHGIPAAEELLHPLHGTIKFLVTIAIGVALGFAAIPAVHVLEKPFGKLMQKLAPFFVKLRKRKAVI
ncbi:MAG: DUF808 domain-containing protein [Micavibrio sp.]|nr:DUF808 domain-containing protein [Micavibrio sp.]